MLIVWEIWNYDLYVRSDAGVRDVRYWKVIGKLCSPVADGLNVFTNFDVSVRSDFGV